MPVVPEKGVDRMQFYADRIDLWTLNAVAIGTTAGEVTALDTKVQAAESAYDAQQLAKDNAKSATETYQQALAAMSVAGATIIDEVRVKARTAGPAVYPLANIPAPDVRSPVPPPGLPANLTVTLDGAGALNLKWKCPNPPGAGGTIYQIWRSLGSTDDFVCLGGCGTKSYRDATLPAGTAQVSYQIQAVRSSAVGPWALFVVKLGVSGAGAGGGGSLMATVTEGTPAKIAA
jgi:hypothetical protein